ncbi:hypothetical protein C3F00_044325, partial [Pseudomonas sp. MWU13-2860]
AWASVVVWAVNFLWLGGIKEAAFINLVTTVAKFVPLLLFTHNGLAHSALARHAIFSLGGCLLWGMISWRLWQAEQDKPRAGKSLASALAVLTLLLELTRLALALSSGEPELEVAGQRQNLLLLMTQWTGYGVVVCQLYLVYERAMDQLLQQSRSD